MLASLSSWLARRRRARDGGEYTFAEFAQHYSSASPWVLAERWREAPPADGAAPHEFALSSVEDMALNLLCAFGSQCVVRALEAGFGESQEQSERIVKELLRAAPHAAGVRRSSPRWRWELALEPLPLEVAIQQHASTDLVKTLLRAYPAAARYNDMLRLAAAHGARPELLAALVCHKCPFRVPQVMPSDALYIARRFTPDRQGLWLLIEVGATIVAQFDAVVSESNWTATAARGLMVGESRVALHRMWYQVMQTLRMWRHGEAVRYRFLTRSFAQKTATPAAAVVAAMLCGECSCPCPACDVAIVAASAPVTASSSVAATSLGQCSEASCCCEHPKYS